jgi:hypothetical protein
MIFFNRLPLLLGWVSDINVASIALGAERREYLYGSDVGRQIKVQRTDNISAATQLMAEIMPFVININAANAALYLFIIVV